MYKEKYKFWLEDEIIDEESKKELLEIQQDEEEIKDRFYDYLTFGTAGLRGRLGAGINRMNKYTVARASQGLADSLLSRGKDFFQKGVVIGHDIRHFSEEFSKLAAEILAGNGIPVYFFDGIRPTPLVGYAVNHLKTAAGIVITASHNPKDYNGYKVYWSNGVQIDEEVAESVEKNSQNYNDFKNISKLDFEKALDEGLIQLVGEEIDEKYYEDILSLAIHDPEKKDLKIVYTPLNGTGNQYVREILNRRGFEEVHIVKEQENPDPDFKSVAFPNPEHEESFVQATKLAKEIGADLILATDPDADRVALKAKDKNGDYVFFNGNRIGSLLTYYILTELSKEGKLPKNPVLVKSIVTGNLAFEIAKKYGVETIETLTGFKNIAGLVDPLEEEGKTWLFGFEESIGYNYGTFVKDKDAVSSSMMLAEMAQFYKNKGKTLVDVYAEISEEFGYYNESLTSFVREGITGQEKIREIMEEFRKSPIEKMGKAKLEKVIDYSKDYTGLPKSNALRYFYNDGSWYALRPSGTEPKIRLYIYTKGDSLEISEEKLEILESEIFRKMEGI